MNKKLFLGILIILLISFISKGVIAGTCDNNLINIQQSACNAEYAEINITGRYYLNIQEAVYCASNFGWVNVQFHLYEEDWISSDDYITADSRQFKAVESPIFCNYVDYEYTFNERLDSFTGGGEGNTLEIYADVYVTNGPEEEICTTPTENIDIIFGQCSSGSCCDTSTCNYKNSGYKCGEDIEADYGCPWGVDYSDDVGVKYKDQYCGGSSNECTGNVVWSGWSVNDNCDFDEKCVENDPTCNGVVCDFNSECGTDEWEGNPVCDNGDVWQSYKTWRCNKPGQGDSTCSYTDSYQLKETCINGCLGGECVIECDIDSECGTTSWWLSQDYCNGEDKWDAWRSNKCYNSGTTSSYCGYADVQQLKQTCTDGCSGGECISCDSHDDSSCYDSDVYWYDSCTIREEKKEECGASSCDDWGADYCYNNDVYHNETCYNKGCSGNSCYSEPYQNEEKVQECGVDGCLSGNCVTCTSHDSYGCYDTDIYWYDSCTIREEKKEECGNNSYIGSNYCYDSDVYIDYNTIGCSVDNCTSSIDKIKQQECGVSGCLAGVCVDNVDCFSDSECDEDLWGTANCENETEVWNAHRTWSCINPGTTSSYCNFIDSYEKINSCPDSCSNGICFTENDGYLWNVDFGSKKIYKLTINGTVISSFDSPGNNPRGLAWDGKYLWLTGGNNSIYKLTVNGTIVDRFNSSSDYPFGLAWDGNYLWQSSSYNIRMYKMTTEGITLSNFILPSIYMAGLTWDGNYLWQLDWNDNKIYKLTTGGAVLSNFNSPAGLGGLAWDGNYLWYSSYYGQKIYKLTTNGTIIDSFDSILPEPVGLAWKPSNEISCSSDSNCGTNSWADNLICNGNNTYQDYEMFNCINPGTTSSYCSFENISVLNETCPGTCTFGVCDSYIECSINTECGNDSYSEVYCSEGNVYKNYIETACINPNTTGSYCSNSSTKILNKTCDDGCNSGSCINLNVPYCENSPCIINEIVSRGDISPFSEPNFPNTIDNCTDGSFGVWREDESIESIRIINQEGDGFKPGDEIKISLWVNCWESGDIINFIYSNSSLNPDWRVIDSVGCNEKGINKFSTIFNLDTNPGKHVIRGSIQYNGDANETCGQGEYDDNDDVIIHVGSSCYYDSDCSLETSWAGQPYCTDDEVQQVYRTPVCLNPGYLNASCSYTEEVKLKQTCLNNCVGGVCEDITCTSDSDCGTNKWLEKYQCNGDFIEQKYRTYMCNNPGINNSYCSHSDDSIIKYECADSCDNGSCVSVKCYSDDDCGDDKYTGDRYCKNNDVYQDKRYYECRNDGTINSYCDYTEKEKRRKDCEYGCSDGYCSDNSAGYTCSSNTDCGTDELIGNSYCSNADVKQNYRMWNCNNPSTNNAYCSYSDNVQLTESCSGECIDGQCITNVCVVDWDCGTDGPIGIPYCSNGDVYHIYRAWDCNAGNCEYSDTSKLKESCGTGCSGGNCINVENNEQADLRVSDLSVTNTSYPSHEHPISLAFDVKNTGNITLNNIGWILYTGEGGTSISGTISELKAGNGMDIVRKITYSGAGTYYLKAIVDPSNDIYEFNEANNQADFILNLS